MPNYPDPVFAFADWLVETLTVGPTGEHRRVLPEEPDDLVAAPHLLPIHVVVRAGGYDPYVGVDLVRLVVDTFATGTDPWQARTAALNRAEDVRRAVRLTLPGTDMGGIWIAKTRCVAAPTIRFYDNNAALRRAQASYELTTHTPI